MRTKWRAVQSLFAEGEIVLASEIVSAVRTCAPLRRLECDWPANDHAELASSSVVVRTVLALLAAVPCTVNNVLLKSSNTSRSLSRTSVEPVDSA